MYWLLGRKSKLSIYNKALLYKQILRPVWAYGIQLWGCTAKSNLKIMGQQTKSELRVETISFQLKISRRRRWTHQKVQKTTPKMRISFFKIAGFRISRSSKTQTLVHCGIAQLIFQWKFIPQCTGLRVFLEREI